MYLHGFSIIVFLILFHLSLAQTKFQQTYSGPNGCTAYGIVVNEDSSYTLCGWYDVQGPVSSELYLIQVDKYGDTVWSKTIGEKIDTNAKHLGGNGGYDIIRTLDKGFLMTGDILGFGSGDEDVYVIKTDENGNHIWSKTYGGPNADIGLSLIQMTDSSYIISGYTESFGLGSRSIYVLRLNGSGDTLWTRVLGGNSIESGVQVLETKDSGVIVIGPTYSFGAGGSDIYVSKLDATGEIEWSKTYGGVKDEYANAIIQTYDNGYVIAGSTASFGFGSDDVYLIKIDSIGNLIWSKTYGGDNFERAQSIKQTITGEIIILGYTKSFGAGREDFYIIKTDDKGDTLWTRTYGGSLSDFGISMKLTNDGGFVLSGFSQSFGATDFTTYLIKTDSLGDSGCHQYGTRTKIFSPRTIDSNAATIITHGATITSAASLQGKTRTVPANPCDRPALVKPIFQEQNFNIYPNPANSVIFLEVPSQFVGGRIIIKNFIGEIVLSEGIESKVMKKDVSELNSGMYYIVIHKDSNFGFSKLIKN